MKKYAVVLDAPGRIYVIRHPKGFNVVSTFADWGADVRWWVAPRILSVAGVSWVSIPEDGRGASLKTESTGRWVRIRGNLTESDFEVL